MSRSKVTYREHSLSPVFWIVRTWSKVGFLWSPSVFPRWVVTSRRHLFLFVYLFLFILYVWVFCLCIIWVPGTQGGQKRALESPEQESQMAVSHQAQSSLQPRGISFSDFKQSWPQEYSRVHLRIFCMYSLGVTLLSMVRTFVRPITDISNVIEKQLKMA